MSVGYCPGQIRYLSSKPVLSQASRSVALLFAQLRNLQSEIDVVLQDYTRSQLDILGILCGQTQGRKERSETYTQSKGGGTGPHAGAAVAAGE